MTKISPEKVIDSSAYVQDALTVSKRLALMSLAAKWRRVDPANVRGTLEPLLPEIEQLMHEQQALGRQIGWTQGQLAAAVATGEAPGSIPLPLDAARDGRLRGGPPFVNALHRAIPGALARISSGVRPDAAVADTGRMVALQLGSIAHDEARLVTQDLVMAQGSGAVPRMGYARKAEGAHTCDFCRTLATRGPVYSTDTAGFRAHRFCDCTTYAVPMETFEVDPKDWAAYQRWATTEARKSARTTTSATNPAFARLDRLDQIEAQIASYEPIVESGNATEWMRSKFDALVDERDALRKEGAFQRLRAQEVPTDLIAGPDWRSQPGLEELFGDLGWDSEKRKLWANQHFLFFDDNTGVGLSLSRVSIPSFDKLEQLQFEINRAVKIAKPDFGFWRNPDISMFDVSDTMPRWVLGSTSASSNRAVLNRKFWDLLDPEGAAAEQAKQVMGRRWSISMMVDPHDSVQAHLLHELGHQVDQPFFDQEFLERSRHLYDKWRYVGQSGVANRQITMLDFDEIPNFQVADIDILREAVTSGPTLYARANQDEMFAEAYATWKLRNKAALDPEMQQWITEYAQEFGWS